MDRRTHARALAQAFLVTLLWSSSVVLIKIGLEDIAPIAFAGLRYGVAFLCLAPLLLTRPARAAIASLGRRDLLLLLALGVVQYAITQGAQFLSLSYLPAATVSLMLAFTPMAVALAGRFALGERLVLVQWLGLGVSLAGALVYFADAPLGQAGRIGLALCAVQLVANAGQVLLGRSINRTAHLPPLVVTTISMGFGAALLLAPTVLAGGLSMLPPRAMLIVGWLAVANTAFAFTLWNHTQRTLPAVETSLVNNSMLVQIAVLAWLVLGDALAPREWAGVALVTIGVLIVQLPKLFRARERNSNLAA
jgi:drug/metabolite transporter (DMT)-like permease